MMDGSEGKKSLASRGCPARRISPWILMHVRPFPAPSPSRARVLLGLAGALCCACFIPPPGIVSHLSSAIADWASIVLAALPYVVVGAFAAALSRRLIRRPIGGTQFLVALFAVLNPGCDCALNGFACALARARPAVAVFALTFAAAASPASLMITFAAFGARMTLARAGGAFIAAALTAVAWSFTSVVPTFMVGHASVVPTFMVGHAVEQHDPDELGDLAAALRGIACAAGAAIAAKVIVPAAFLAHMPPPAAALFGALLSPCSTADPLLAAALLRDLRAQLVFMLAAQCLDVRQMLLVHRHFGVARMAAAAVCCSTACALATLFA